MLLMLLTEEISDVIFLIYFSQRLF